MTKNALLEKGPKNSGMGRLPSLIRAMPERKRFFIEAFPYETKFFVTEQGVEKNPYLNFVLATMSSLLVAITKGRRRSQTMGNILKKETTQCKETKRKKEIQYHTITIK